MRLFLHGRYTTEMLLERIKQAQEMDVDETMANVPSSLSSLSASSSRYYSSILLSNWNMDEIDPSVVDALEAFLRASPRNEEDTPSDQDENILPCREVMMQQSAFSLSQASLFSQLSCDDSRAEESPREVILQNCEGQEGLEKLVELVMQTNSSLTIRYDKKRRFPTSIAMGLRRGAENQDDESPCPLRTLTLKGMTLTPPTAKWLRQTLPLLPNLNALTIRGNITLIELDNKGSSVAGETRSRMVHVVEALHDMLENLPLLEHLDLQHCHLPDQFLADLLEALNPESIRSLNLNGNMAQEESQMALYELLSHENCRLEDLDLSWQRLPNARRNCSVLDLEMLTRALAGTNTSLKTLNLSENQILSEDATDLARALTQHPNISKVRLQDCYLGDKGMVAIAREIPKWPEHLKDVHLDGQQKIRKKDAVRKYIRSMLVENVFLRELALPHSVQCTTTEFTLELNKAGRRALLEPVVDECPNNLAIECTITKAPSFDSQDGTNHISNALWPNVLERADKISRREYNQEESSNANAASALYLLLREKGYHAVIEQH